MLASEPTYQFFNMIEQNPEGFIESENIEKLESSDTVLVAYLYQLLGERSMTLRDLIYEMPISKSYFYQITSKRRNMGRDVAIVLSLTLNLDLDETQKLLQYSNNAVLYPKIRRDAILICCIKCGMTYAKANEVLNKKGEKGLL